MEKYLRCDRCKRPDCFGLKFDCIPNDYRYDSDDVLVNCIYFSEGCECKMKKKDLLKHLEKRKLEHTKMHVNALQNEYMKTQFSGDPNSSKMSAEEKEKCKEAFLKGLAKGALHMMVGI